MPKLIVTEFISVDGIAEVEKLPSVTWNDEMQKFKDDELADCGAMLLGRTTYEIFAGSWPSETEDFAERFNACLDELDAARIPPAIDAIEFAATRRRVLIRPFLLLRRRHLDSATSPNCWIWRPRKDKLGFWFSDGTETSRNSGCRYGGLQSANGGRRIRHARTSSDPSHRTGRSRHR
ncbi:dihydrofolate reductase family protein [Mesorhizobium sp. M0208]|uniref:dihydrofolate reductase family protein n=1 Tax=Mesorhizobium sp. M0208 TaxID=2956916 RepID=UPI00333BC83E